MKKRTKIIMGTLLLLLAFGIVYSLTTPPNTEADCLRHYITCSYPEHVSWCPGNGINAWHNYRCHPCLSDGCPAVPSGCVSLGYTCMFINKLDSGIQ